MCTCLHVSLLAYFFARRLVLSVHVYIHVLYLHIHECTVCYAGLQILCGDLHVKMNTESYVHVHVLYPRKRGPTTESQPTPHFELSFLLRSQVYLNKHPYVSSLEYAPAIAI